MDFDLDLYAQNRRRFLENRQQSTAVELAKHRGKWVAWSPDGSRIVASAAQPEELEMLVRAAKEDPMQCVIEGIPDGDGQIGGSSLCG